MAKITICHILGEKLSMYTRRLCALLEIIFAFSYGLYMGDVIHVFRDVFVTFSTDTA